MKVEGVKCDACSAKDSSEDAMLPLNWVHLDVEDRNSGRQDMDLCPKHGAMTLEEVVELATKLKKKRFG